MKKVIKKMLCLIMAVLMVAGFFPVIADAEEISAKGVASATVSVSTAKVGAGGNAKVTISLSEGSNVAMAQFAVKYDSSIFKFVSASSGEVMGDVTTNSYEDGTVYFGWDDPTPVTAGGTILELVFRVPDNAELGEYPVEIDTEEKFVFADADSNDLNMIIENGKIEIIDGIYGDLNGDENIDIKDTYLARLIAAKLITPTENQSIFGDVDLDHKITAIDANLLRKYAVKLIEKLPYRNEEPEGNKPQKPDDGEYAVAMITDYGGITDQSFNQTTYEACEAFCDENDIPFEYYKPETDSDDLIGCIEMAIDDGYNVIVMPGFAFANAIIAVADENPEVKFVALDISEFDLTGNGWTIPENVYSAVYQEEISGYMAGYAAVKLGYTELGFLGGMAIPAVCRYGYGFLQGADAAAVETGADVSVVWGYANQFYGDADITAVMDTWYGEGTEVVFTCGGGIYTSVAEAAAKVGGKVIGVDVDQAPIIDGLYGEGMTVTSAMKGLAPTVKTVLGKIISGEFEGGQVERLGIVSADPEENYVQLASSTQFNDLFTYNDYSALVKEIFEGRITVNDDITGAPADYVTVISVYDIGNVK